jgi:hypothetical protein
MPKEASDPPDELSPRERARLRNRDRKRSTRMVVDNAGVKRTALALARRRQAGPPAAAEPPQD